MRNSTATKEAFCQTLASLQCIITLRRQIFFWQYICIFLHIIPRCWNITWLLSVSISKHIMLKVHLHYIRDLGPSIRVRARTQSKQVNWCFVFTLIRVRVRDVCLGRPCPSSSLHVAISSDTDVPGRPRSCNAHAQSHRFTWLLLQATKKHEKWPLPRVTSDPSLGCSVNTILSGARTLTQIWILGQCKCKCALTKKVPSHKILLGLNKKLWPISLNTMRYLHNEAETKWPPLWQTTS